jgi:hypothetical protein
MSACENLPQELIAAIVDNIRDDRKSLEAFSLVCKAWTNPAREHLFALLTFFGGEDRLEKAKAANITSTYTPFLRDLHLSSWEDDHKFWHEIIPFLTDFRTPRLRFLALGNLPWHALSSDERSAFLRRFESIVSLRLSLFKQDISNDIATIICSFPHLQKLVLVRSSHMIPLPGPSPLSLNLHLPERLSTLRIVYVYSDYRSVLEWLASGPERLSIHALHISMRWLYPQDLDTINVFLKALGPALEVFGCDSDGVFMPCATMIELFYIYHPQSIAPLTSLTTPTCAPLNFASTDIPKTNRLHCLHSPRWDLDSLNRSLSISIVLSGEIETFPTPNGPTWTRHWPVRSSRH